LSRYDSIPAWQRPAAQLLMVAAIGIGAVGAALVTQHVWGMQPCPWCILQRIIFLLIAAVALLGLAARGGVRRAAAGGVMLLAASGVAAALWQHFVAAASASCSQTLADRIISGLGLDGWWPEVFAVMASCADAKVHLAGVPYEFYSLTLFVVQAGLVWPLLRRR
jgi:disulfide bond formation protein DsbB